jgi:hypothetical protein
MQLSAVFIPKCVGVSDDYPWINSDDDDYVMDKIRDDFLADSTVTLVMVGKCTWSRKSVDWEVYSSSYARIAQIDSMTFLAFSCRAPLPCLLAPACPRG